MDEINSSMVFDSVFGLSFALVRGWKLVNGRKSLWLVLLYLDSLEIWGKYIYMLILLIFVFILVLHQTFTRTTENSLWYICFNIIILREFVCAWLALLEESSSGTINDIGNRALSSTDKCRKVSLEFTRV